MKRLVPIIALLPGLVPAVPAAAASAGHEHPGLLFQIRAEPELNSYFVYRAFLPDPHNPGSLIVERSDTYLADRGQVDLRPTDCPALRRAVDALATLPMPAVSLVEPRNYDYTAPRGEAYFFNGFVHFPNGGEGEISFVGYDVPGRRADPQLAWMRGLTRAFDACRPRGEAVAGAPG